MLNVDIDDRGVATVTLDRPDVRNALNIELAGKLLETFQSLDGDQRVRVIVIAGNGKAFCAGADLNYMKAMADYSEAENAADARRLGALFNSIRTNAKPTVARVHGAAFAGGIGLLAAADIAIAAENTLFSISEVKLGLVPANIMPYLVDCMGSRNVRRYAVTGERFDAATAFHTGLVHQVTPEADLDTVVGKVVEELLGAGPVAVGECRKLIDMVDPMLSMETREQMSGRLAALRVGEEAQQRLAAFLDKAKR